MKWQRRSANSIQYGEWTVSRAKVLGREIFTLWQGKTEVSQHHTADAAKAAALRGEQGEREGEQKANKGEQRGMRYAV